MKRTYSHIDMDERRKIARWRMAGLTVGIIAEKLGRHRSTIFREIRRNMFINEVVPDVNGYYCVTAHEIARARRAKLGKLVRFSRIRPTASDQAVAASPRASGSAATSHARRTHGQRFSPKLNILRRPNVVADRKQFGHRECDLIQFRKKFGKANVTSLVERVSRFAIFLRNNDRQSRPVMNGLVQALQALPHLARRSTTFDRGTERGGPAW